MMVMPTKKIRDVLHEQTVKNPVAVRNILESLCDHIDALAETQTVAGDGNDAAENRLERSIRAGETLTRESRKNHETFISKIHEENTTIANETNRLLSRILDALDPAKPDALVPEAAKVDPVKSPGRALAEKYITKDTDRVFAKVCSFYVKYSSEAERDAGILLMQRTLSDAIDVILAEQFAAAQREQDVKRLKGDSASTAVWLSSSPSTNPHGTAATGSDRPNQPD